MAINPNTQIWLVGGGLSSLSAAVFLIRDAAVAGKNIHILEDRQTLGGSIESPRVAGLDGIVGLGGFWLSETVDTALWDLLASIPTIEDGSISVRDALFRYNENSPIDAKARLIDRNHQILDASQLGLSSRDRAELLRLVSMSEKKIGGRRIEDFFSNHFFESAFWCLWQTTFGFSGWHSAAELRRYVLRFFHEMPRLGSMSGFLRTPHGPYDTLVRPIEKWLSDRGVQHEGGVRVFDVDLEGEPDRRHVARLHVAREGRTETIAVSGDDVVLLTLGSQSADASFAGADARPELIRDRRDETWTLWENLARKSPDFGRPNAFRGNVDETMGELFTLAMSDPTFVQRVEQLSGNQAGTGGLITFRDSSWLLSVAVPRPSQDEGGVSRSLITARGLNLDTQGDYVKKRMPECTGRELLDELIGQFGFADIADTVKATTQVTAVLLPYLSAPFERRTPGERPPVLPRSAENFGFLGQFVDIEGGASSTVEYAVRGAMLAVYGLFGLQRPMPEHYRGASSLKVAWATMREAFT